MPDWLIALLIVSPSLIFVALLSRAAAKDWGWRHVAKGLSDFILGAFVIPAVAVWLMISLVDQLH
jgi:hypothetical protein